MKNRQRLACCCGQCLLLRSAAAPQQLEPSGLLHSSAWWSEPPVLVLAESRGPSSTGSEQQEGDVQHERSAADDAGACSPPLLDSASRLLQVNNAGRRLHGAPAVASFRAGTVDWAQQMQLQQVPQQRKFAGLQCCLLHCRQRGGKHQRHQLTGC